MNHKKFLPLLAVASLALPSAAFSQIVVVDYGPSSSYVTSDQNLSGNGSFTTSNISPVAPAYTGSAFWGGARISTASTGLDTWAVMNDWTSAGSNDSIRGRRGSLVTGDSGTFVAMFSGTQAFTLDNTSNSSFYLKGRRDGGGTAAGVTGVRWLLRDLDGNYYASALNDSTAAQFGDTYANNTGVTQTGVLGINWFNYTFGTGAVGTQITDTSNFFATTQFDAAGFNYVTQRQSNGAIDMAFADFTVTAIPEPASGVLMGLAGLAFLRRRRRTA